MWIVPQEFFSFIFFSHKKNKKNQLSLGYQSPFRAFSKHLPGIYNQPGLTLLHAYYANLKDPIPSIAQRTWTTGATHYTNSAAQALRTNGRVNY